MHFFFPSFWGGGGDAHRYTVHTHLLLISTHFFQEKIHIHRNADTHCFVTCGTVTVTATTTSGPAVEQTSVTEKQQQMLSSQLQDYLSLNKLHYCLYYAGIHRPGKSTLQNHCLPTTSRPHTASFDYRARKGWRAGEGGWVSWGESMRRVFLWLCVSNSG